MSRNSIEKMAKNVHQKTLIFVVVFFIIGALVGFGAYKFITKDDCFKLVGQEKITLNIGDPQYIDEGVVAVAFGKDITDKVKVDETGVDYSTAGEYHILYTVESPIYEKFTLYRTIVIVDPSAAGSGE